MDKNCGACHLCIEAKRDPDDWMGHQFMILCPTCGCKRCPKATCHQNVCTGSNESGQVGSVYGKRPYIPGNRVFDVELAMLSGEVEAPDEASALIQVARSIISAFGTDDYGISLSMQRTDEEKAKAWQAIKERSRRAAERFES